MKIWLVALCLASCVDSYCQTDSLQAPNQAAEDTTVYSSAWKRRWNMKPHSPLKATVYSAILPGTGQAYNRKYWKMPIVYAGIGVSTGFIIHNTREYKYYKQQYIWQVDGDPATNPEVNADNLLDVQDQYRRWLDLSYLSLFAVYVLQILDANVDGHLFYYNVNKDLSMQLQPCLLQDVGNRPGLGLCIRF